MPSSASSVMRWKLPADFDIFRPLISRCAPCTHSRAGGPPTIGADCAISSSWWGKTLSSPPVWMSNVGPRWRSAIAEHSRCQPGKALAPAAGPVQLAPRLGRLPEREVRRDRACPPRPRPRFDGRPAARRGCCRTARRSPGSSRPSSTRCPRPSRSAWPRSTRRSASASMSATCSVARGNSWAGRMFISAASAWNAAS